MVAARERMVGRFKRRTDRKVLYRIQIALMTHAGKVYLGNAKLKLTTVTGPLPEISTSAECRYFPLLIYMKVQVC